MSRETFLARSWLFVLTKPASSCTWHTRGSFQSG